MDEKCLYDSDCYDPNQRCKNRTCVDSDIWDTCSTNITDSAFMACQYGKCLPGINRCVGFFDYYWDYEYFDNVHCEENEHCRGDYYCKKNPSDGTLSCQPRPKLYEACDTQKGIPCASPLECMENVCMAPCWSDKDCDKGYVCTKYNRAGFCKRDETYYSTVFLNPGPNTYLSHQEKEKLGKLEHGHVGQNAANREHAQKDNASMFSGGKFTVYYVIIPIVFIILLFISYVVYRRKRANKRQIVHFPISQHSKPRRTFSDYYGNSLETVPLYSSAPSSEYT